MRYNFYLLILILSVSSFQYHEQEYKLLKTVKQSYILSGKKHTSTFVEINKLDVIKLNEGLKALAAYYACMASTDFLGDGNSLVNSLNLGNQGSNEHKMIIKKWFYKDRVANVVLKQNCFQPSPGSSYFRVFDYLNFRKKEDTIFISYKLILYNHGKSSVYKGIDKALIKNNEIIMLIQNIWK